MTEVGDLKVFANTDAATYWNSIPAADLPSGRPHLFCSDCWPDLRGLGPILI
jgi:hypothetical protein